MNYQLQKLAARKQHLIAQAASQRMLLTYDADSLRKPLAMADKGLTVLRYIKHHPLLVAGGGATLISIAKPSKIGKWFRLGWLARQILNKFRSK